jgi:hypothetical protein
LGAKAPNLPFGGFVATFKCLTSGQTVTFIYQHDIDSMKGHQGYVRIDVAEGQQEETPVVINLTPPTKRQGRPRKLENVRN